MVMAEEVVDIITAATTTAAIGEEAAKTAIAALRALDYSTCRNRSCRPMRTSTAGFRNRNSGRLQVSASLRSTLIIMVF